MPRISFPWSDEVDFVPRSDCFVATAIIGSAVVGAGASIAGSQTAANAQTQASQNAINAQQQMFNVTQQNLSPYNTAGQGALTALQGLTGTNTGGNPLTAPLTAQFQPTQAQLAATPGYQFTLNQGLESTQNAYAAQGPRVSRGLPSRARRTTLRAWRARRISNSCRTTSRRMRRRTICSRAKSASARTQRPKSATLRRRPARVKRRVTRMLVRPKPQPTSRPGTPWVALRARSRRRCCITNYMARMPLRAHPSLAVAAQRRTE